MTLDQHNTKIQKMIALAIENLNKISASAEISSELAAGAMEAINLEQKAPEPTKSQIYQELDALWQLQRADAAANKRLCAELKAANDELQKISAERQGVIKAGPHTWVTSANYLKMRAERDACRENYVSLEREFLELKQRLKASQEFAKDSESCRADYESIRLHDFVTQMSKLLDIQGIPNYGLFFQACLREFKTIVDEKERLSKKLQDTTEDFELVNRKFYLCDKESRKAAEEIYDRISRDGLLNFIKASP